MVALSAFSALECSTRLGGGGEAENDEEEIEMPDIEDESHGEEEIEFPEFMVAHVKKRRSSLQTSKMRFIMAWMYDRIIFRMKPMSSSTPTRVTCLLSPSLV